MAGSALKAQWARHETVGSAPAQFRRHPHEPRAYVRYGMPGKPTAQWRHRTNGNAPTHPVTVPMDPCSTSSEPDGGISRSSMLHRCHPAECSTAPDRFPTPSTALAPQCAAHALRWSNPQVLPIRHGSANESKDSLPWLRQGMRESAY